MRIKGKNKTYIYDHKSDEHLYVEKSLKIEFAKFCKEKGINKSKMIQEFYKKVLLAWHDGTLNASNGYITFNILSSSIRKLR